MKISAEKIELANEMKRGRERETNSLDRQTSRLNTKRTACRYTDKKHTH